ncbi:MAG: vWA domain-containing protein [Deltaproteobacteria bacterium]
MNKQAIFVGSRFLLGGCTSLLALGLGAAIFASCSASGLDDGESVESVEGNGLGADGPVFEDGTVGSATMVGFDGQGCVGQTAGTEVAPSVLQLLVDTSGSMDQDAPGRGSKWEQTRRAVLGAIDGMPGDTSVGVVFYPNVPNNAMPCFDRQTAVNLARLDAGQQRQQIRQAFGDQNPNGGTPTHDAYAYAVAELARGATIGQRFLVLITDGIPTYSLGCDTSGRQGNDDAVDGSPLVGEAARALASGVRTFVIGSPGSDGARESLSRMAEAGGTARAACSHTGPEFCHFDMTRATDLGAELDAALKAISGLALSCSYDIPAPPLGTVLDPGKVNLLFTPAGGQVELVGQSPNGSCTEGWQYSGDGTQIRLCGSTCERVRSSQGSLNLQFGCSTQVR